MKNCVYGGGLKSRLFWKTLKVILKYTFTVKIWSIRSFKGQEQIAKLEVLSFHWYVSIPMMIMR